MKRKPVLSPCLMMLILAVISFLTDLESVKYQWRLDPYYEPDIWIFRFTLLYVLEAIVYWIIRYRITRPANAWAHIFIILIGVYTFPYVNLFYRGRMMNAIINHRSDPFVEGLGKTIIWSRIPLQILAHIFFALAIIQAYKKRPVAIRPAGPQEHLLDDVQ